MRAGDLCAEEVRGMLDYDHGDGLLRWRRDNGPARKGSIAGTVSKAGHIAIGLGGRVYMAHRLVWIHVHGKWPEGKLVHRNGRKWDNRIENLQEVLPDPNRLTMDKVARQLRGW